MMVEAPRARLKSGRGATRRMDPQLEVYWRLVMALGRDAAEVKRLHAMFRGLGVAPRRAKMNRGIVPDPVGRIPPMKAGEARELVASFWKGASSAP